MKTKKERTSAEEILNNLAKILAEPDPLEGTEEIYEDTKAFVKMGMEIIDDWRRETMLEIGRTKAQKFKDFLANYSKFHTAREIRQAIEETIKPFSSEQQLVFYSRLEKITDEELQSLDDDSKILELWTSIFKKKDE